MSVYQIAHPQLVKYDSLIPYLRRIDESRIYSNFGPLVEEFEQRLNSRFGHVASVSSCTAGITAALLALDLPRGYNVIMPSWTFVATAHAIRAAGLVPYFMDVDETGTLSSDIKIPKFTACIIPVSSFGEPMDYLKWERFQEATGVPILIDAAGGFDSHSWNKSKLPAVISTHATKVLSTGEGGLVVSRDKDFIKKVRRITNFGFSETRTAEHTSLNAKMSEYHAAVGLAELDNWQQKREKWRGVKRDYITAFKGVGDSLVYGDTWVGSIFCLRLRSLIKPVIERLAFRNIMAKQLWGAGCHTHPAYLDAPRSALGETQSLSEKTIFLPFSIDMKKEDIEYIKNKVTECI